MRWLPPDREIEMFAELWLVGMVWVLKIGSGSKSGVISWGPPSREAPSKNCTRPSGESGKSAPWTVAVKVTEPHAVEGFDDDETVVNVGKPTASAGSADDTAPTRGTSASASAIAIHRFMFMRASGHDGAAPGRSSLAYR